MVAHLSLLSRILSLSEDLAREHVSGGVACNVARKYIMFLSRALVSVLSTLDMYGVVGGIENGVEIPDVGPTVAVPVALGRLFNVNRRLIGNDANNSTPCAKFVSEVCADVIAASRLLSAGFLRASVVPSRRLEVARDMAAGLVASALDAYTLCGVCTSHVSVGSEGLALCATPNCMALICNSCRRRAGGAICRCACGKRAGVVVNPFAGVPRQDNPAPP